MKEKQDENLKPDPARLEALRNLPPEVLKGLDKEEIRAFLFEDEWPESLSEKLKEYLAGEDGTIT